VSLEQERASLVADIAETARRVSVLGDRALNLGSNEAYYALNGAWRKLDEAERLLSGRPERGTKR